jgi:hypothetical protein
MGVIGSGEQESAETTLTVQSMSVMAMLRQSDGHIADEELKTRKIFI